MLQTFIYSSSLRPEFQTHLLTFSEDIHLKAPDRIHLSQICISLCCQDPRILEVGESQEIKTLESGVLRLFLLSKVNGA